MIAVGETRKECGSGIFKIEEIDERVGVALVRWRYNGSRSWVPLERVEKTEIIA